MSYYEKFFEALNRKQEKEHEADWIVVSARWLDANPLGPDLSDVRMEMGGEEMELHPSVQEVGVQAWEWYKEKYPRRRKVTVKRIVEEPDHGEVRDMLKPLSDFVEELRSDALALGIAMTTLAREAVSEVQEGDNYEPVEVSDVSTSTYRSQGFGAARYTQKAAEARVKALESYGIKTASISEERYRLVVSVRCAQEDAEILRKLPSLEDEPFIQFCKDNGVNPRVYRPYIHQRVGNEVLRNYGF